MLLNLGITDSDFVGLLQVASLAQQLNILLGVTATFRHGYDMVEFNQQSNKAQQQRDTAFFRVGSCKSALDFLFCFSITFFGFFDGVNHGKIV